MDHVARLTAKEREVLDLLCQGYECEEIALKLGDRAETIRTHMKRIREKRSQPSIFKVVVRELLDNRAVASY